MPTLSESNNALNEANKLDILFKKNLGKTATVSTLGWSSEILSTSNVAYAKDTWLDTIKDVTDYETERAGAGNGWLSSDGVVRWYDGLVLSVVTGTSSRVYKHDDLKDSIVFFGTYLNVVSVKVTKSSNLNEELTKGADSGGGWLIDSSSGALVFYAYGNVTSKVDAANPPKVSFYRYVGQKLDSYDLDEDRRRINSLEGIVHMMETTGGGGGGGGGGGSGLSLDGGTLNFGNSGINMANGSITNATSVTAATLDGTLSTGSSVQPNITSLAGLRNAGASGATTTYAGDITVNGNLKVLGLAEFSDGTTGGQGGGGGGGNSNGEFVSLIVQDNYITLGNVQSPGVASDISASGGGLKLKGTTEKSLLWNNPTGWSLTGGDLDVGTNKVKSSAVPTENSDLANKLYVDRAGGLTERVNSLEGTVQAQRMAVGELDDSTTASISTVNTKLSTVSSEVHTLLNNLFLYKWALKENVSSIITQTNKATKTVQLSSGNTILELDRTARTIKYYDTSRNLVTTKNFTYTSGYIINKGMVGVVSSSGSTHNVQLYGTDASELGGVITLTSVNAVTGIKLNSTGSSFVSYINTGGATYFRAFNRSGNNWVAFSDDLDATNPVAWDFNGTDIAFISNTQKMMVYEWRNQTWYQKGQTVNEPSAVGIYFDPGKKIFVTEGSRVAVYQLSETSNQWTLLHLITHSGVFSNFTLATDYYAVHIGSNNTILAKRLNLDSEWETFSSDIISNSDSTFFNITSVSNSLRLLLYDKIYHVESSAFSSGISTAAGVTTVSGNFQCANNIVFGENSDFSIVL